MQEIIRNIQELANILTSLQSPVEGAQPSPEEPFEPWRAFEPVNGLTYL